MAASAAPHRRDRPPTCVDDDADHGLRVPDGAASKQQVFLVQPGLLPVVVRAAEGVCHVSPRCPHALTPGAWTLGGEGSRGPGRAARLSGFYSSWMELVLTTGDWASRSISRA